MLPSRLPFTLARCHEVLGQFDQAESVLSTSHVPEPERLPRCRRRQFLSSKRSTGQGRADLHKLLEPASPAPFTLQAPARQQLALILAGTGEPDGIRQALELLGKGHYPDDEMHPLSGTGL